MIDILNAKYEFSKEEEYAIKWFDENGFDGKINKQLQTKTRFIVSKNGVDGKFELPQRVVISNIKSFMEQWNKSFELSCKIRELQMKNGE